MDELIEAALYISKLESKRGKGGGAIEGACSRYVLLLFILFHCYTDVILVWFSLIHDSLPRRRYWDLLCFTWFSFRDLLWNNFIVVACFFYLVVFWY